jgi:hypothetical protein
LAEGKLATLQVEGLPLVRQWFLIHRTDRQLTKAAEVLRHFIIGHKGEILP